VRLHEGIPVWGSHQENTLSQLVDVASRADKSALMADGHLGYIMPVGGVCAYEAEFLWRGWVRYRLR